MRASLSLLPLLLLSLTSLTSAKYAVMPWMCLERCGENITADLANIAAHKDQLTTVSYEAFDLGLSPDGKTPMLIDNNFTRVGGALKAMGLKTQPMITTVDIDKLRALFANPGPFIKAVSAALTTFGADGVNLDFEPCQDTHPTCNTTDGKNYGTFLDVFTRGLRADGFTVSVDIASWSPFWDFDAIAASSVDKLLTMDTYGGWDEFQSGLAKIMKVTRGRGGVDRFGVGLCCTCGGAPNMTARFELMAAHGIREVDVWDFPIPEQWYTFFA